MSISLSSAKRQTKKRHFRKLVKETERNDAISNAKIRYLVLEKGRIDILMTKVLGYECKDFHLLMYKHRQHRCKKQGKQRWHLALAPRGGGKTTILTISTVIMEILRNPLIRILIASKTDGNAVEMLSEIKKKLESDKVREIFGDYVGRVWNDGEITTCQRDKTPNAPKGKTVSTVGVGSALASRHFEAIFADDLVDEENSATERQRTKVIQWFFKVLDPTLRPEGLMSIVGTRYHFSDLYGHLIDKMFAVTDKEGNEVPHKSYYIRIPALIKRKNASRAKKKHKRYISYWPEKFSVKFLLAKKRSQGTINFNSQYQNDTKAMQGKIFKYDWFKFINRAELDVGELLIYQGVDLAIKQQDDADKFSHVTIGIHPKTKNIYVLDYYNRVTHYTKQKMIISEKDDKWEPVKVGIEANGYQRSLLQDMRDNPNLAMIPTFPIFTEIDKTLRAWKLSAYFERGQIYFMEGMHEICSHLLKIPDGRYKDLFDALDIAIQIAGNRAGVNRKSKVGVIKGNNKKEEKKKTLILVDSSRKPFKKKTRKRGSFRSGSIKEVA